MFETLKLIIEEHRVYKKQILRLSKSDLIKTYRGAALGWAWALVKPLITLFVFWFGFTVGLRSGKPVNGYPYFLWLLAGFLPWFYMRDMLPGGAECIRKYSHLVTKIKFPVSIIPTYTSISNLITHLVLTAITIVVFALWGCLPDIYYLQIPFYMLLMWMFFEVWGLFAGMLSAMSKDFLNLVKSFTQALFWLSGVIYDVNKIQHPVIRTILKFNPITVISSGYRKAFIYKQWFWEDKVELIGYATTFLVVFLLALWAYKKLRKEIPDVL
jgi:teichoic acid transport system permease protein